MHLLAAVLLLGGLLPRLPAGARAEDSFRHPPGPGPTGDYRDNPVYAVGDSVDLQWETTLESADLALCQGKPGGDDDARPACATIVANAKAKSLVWTVGYGGLPAHQYPGLSPVYYLELSKAGETTAGRGMRSHYFNITGTRPAATARTTGTTTKATAKTTGSGGTMSAATASTKRTTVTTAGTNSTATAASTSQTPTGAPAADGPDAESQPQSQSQSQSQAAGDGLSGGVVAGIAVGAFLGGLALLGGTAWAVRRRGRRAGGGVAHTQGDIVMYAERQLREKGALAWRTTPPPVGRNVRLPVEDSREALAFELDGTSAAAAAEHWDWAAWGAAAAVDRAMMAGCGSGSTRSGSSGWRSMEARTWA